VIRDPSTRSVAKLPHSAQDDSFPKCQVPFDLEVYRAVVARGEKSVKLVTSTDQIPSRRGRRTA